MLESSRKQQFADWVLTLSKGFEGSNPNNLGIFTLPKCRRGDTNLMEYFIRLRTSGRFKVIPKGVWDDIKSVPDKMMYTEADIDAMVNNYNTQRMQLDRQVNQYGSPSQPRQPINTPFGKI